MPASVSLSRDIEEIYHNLWRADVRRDRDPSLALLHHRIVTCLVWELSGSSALAEAYLLSKRVTDLGTTVEEYSPERCVLLFSEWLLAEHDAVLTAMMDIENSYRVQADCFLVRSLTALMVHIQSQKGVLVPSSESVYYYLRLWSLRPVSTALQPLLTRLTYHRNARRNSANFYVKSGCWIMAPSRRRQRLRNRKLMKGFSDLVHMVSLECIELLKV